MSDIRFPRLERQGARRSGDKVVLSMPLPTTPNGMESRRCSNEECEPRLVRRGDILASTEPRTFDTRLHRVPQRGDDLSLLRPRIRRRL